jgi:RNA polymerase sigma-70 factor, ECF subfamily
VPLRAPDASSDSAASRPSLVDPAELRLVEALRRNDRKAAAQFVAGYTDAVYAYARHRLAPRADLVDDVVQDVLLAALGGLAAFRGQSSLKTWVLGIARHKIEDVYRRRLRAAVGLEALTADEEPPAPGPGVDVQMDDARRRDRTKRVMADLPEQYGLMLLWRYWEQRSTREMAEALGTTEKSVERMLARARARFKEAWLKE